MKTYSVLCSTYGYFKNTSKTMEYAKKALNLASSTDVKPVKLTAAIFRGLFYLIEAKKRIRKKLNSF